MNTGRFFIDRIFRDDKELRFLVVSAVLPNLFFSVIAWFLGLGRPLISIDYAIIAIVIFSRFYILGYFFLIGAVAADVFLLVGQVFPFIRLQDAFYLFGFLHVVSATYQLAILGLALAALVIVYMFCRFRKGGSYVHLLAFLNVALLCMTLEVYSSDKSSNRFWRVADLDMVDSQVLYFYNYRSRGFVETYNLTGAPFSPAGYEAANHWLGSSPANGRLLLIVNESWGVAKSSELTAALLNTLVTSPVVEEVSLGELPFVGATVAGELRELCRLSPNHFNLKDVSAGFEDCLPNKLSEMGYSTRAMHGAVGLMYDRLHWYPRAGFQRSTFFESKAWPERCYSFPGACDLDLMDELKSEFALPGKRFMYWLTLNTHSVYDLRDLRLPPLDCKRYGVVEDSESCRNFRLQAQFFQGLAETLRDDRMKGVEILIVGDHSPPVFNKEEKNNYFSENKVSWLHFKVKD